ncbi:MAG: alpha/beta hydrolase [Vicinamibacterales bacterium]
MSRPEQVIYLPGIRGEAAFWEPVATRVAAVAPPDVLRYPWASGSGPIDEAASFDDLAGAVTGRIDKPTALVAQSLGGVVAVLAASKRMDLVTHLVLVATSGGVRTDDLGVIDWQTLFFDTYPHVPRWMGAPLDLAAQLAQLTMPALLLWGDADPISPLAIGERLLSLMPSARLEVMAGGEHDLAVRHADAVAAAIAGHLRHERPR